MKKNILRAGLLSGFLVFGLSIQPKKQELKIWEELAEKEAKNYPEQEYRKKRAELKQEYRSYELHKSVIGNELEKHRLSYFSCGTNFCMTLDQMREKIKKKFKSMKQEGIIVSIKDFEAVKKKYYISTDPYKYENIHGNLTRIWGAEYLKDKLIEFKDDLKQYAVPNYVIVVDNLSNFTVTLGEMRCYRNGRYSFPAPAVNGLENAMICFENIEGVGCAKEWGEMEKLREKVGYTDFGDRGNIIKQEGTGKRYFVDTELRSFTFPPMPLSWGAYYYFMERFMHVNGIFLSKFGFSFKLSFLDRSEEDRV